MKEPDVSEIASLIRRVIMGQEASEKMRETVKQSAAGFRRIGYSRSCILVHTVR